MTVIDDAWSAIRQEGRSEHGWHVRRVYERAPCQIQAGIRQPERVPGLLIEVLADDVPAGLSLPKSKGFVVEPLLLDGRASGHVRFALVLADRAYETVFSVLCDDTARAASAAMQPRVAVRDWINRLHVWQEFMARHNPNGLSEIAAIGLFGELLVMRDIVIPAAGLAAAVHSWKGPLGEPNDFAFAEGFLEVKTTTRQVPEWIEVSDIDQLDDSRGEIVLAHVRLRASPGGETLAELVSSLRKAFILGAADCMERLEQMLMLVGYLDVHSELYNASYKLEAVDLFHVTDDFPRLRRSDLSRGIRWVSYTIEIAVCSAHSADLRAIRGLLGEQDEDG